MFKKSRRFYLLKNHDSIFVKIKKSLMKINCWFKHRWYPLNRTEIEMLNQIFEGCEKVKINDIIRIQGEDYFITNTKFRFNCFLTANDPDAWDITIEYRGENKKTAIIDYQYESFQGPFFGDGFYTVFDKDNNKWIKTGTGHWIS